MGQIHWASCTGGIHWYPRVSPKIWGSKCSWLFKHYASPTVIGSWGNPSGWFSVSLPVWQDPRLRYIHPKGVLEVAAPPCLCSRKLPARKNKAKQQNHCCRAGNSDRSGFSSVLHVKNQVDTSNVAKEKKHRWEKNTSLQLCHVRGSTIASVQNWCWSHHVRYMCLCHPWNWGDRNKGHGGALESGGLASTTMTVAFVTGGTVAFGFQSLRKRICWIEQRFKHVTM